MPNWYYEKKDLRMTPSSADGIEFFTESRYRREGARFIINMGTKMGLAFDTMASGVVFFHRFYMFYSFREFPRYVTACCCLFLAGKVEETPKKCKDIIKTARQLLNDVQYAQFGEDPKEEVMILERILLQTIKFDFQVEHPYSFLLKYAKSLKGDKQNLQKVVQMAWTFVNDSLCTTLCLQWEPEVIAIALMYLACKCSKFEVNDWAGRLPDHMRWWDMFVENISKDLLEDICHQVLDLYSSANDPANLHPTSPPSLPPSKIPIRTHRNLIPPMIGSAIPTRITMAIHPAATVLPSKATIAQPSLRRSRPTSPVPGPAPKKAKRETSEDKASKKQTVSHKQPKPEEIAGNSISVITQPRGAVPLPAQQVISSASGAPTPGGPGYAYAYTTYQQYPAQGYSVNDSATSNTSAAKRYEGLANSYPPAGGHPPHHQAPPAPGAAPQQVYVTYQQQQAPAGYSQQPVQQGQQPPAYYQQTYKPAAGAPQPNSNVQTYQGAPPPPPGFQVATTVAPTVVPHGQVVYAAPGSNQQHPRHPTVVHGAPPPGTQVKYVASNQIPPGYVIRQPGPAAPMQQGGQPPAPPPHGQHPPAQTMHKQSPAPSGHMMSAHHPPPPPPEMTNNGSHQQAPMGHHNSSSYNQEGGPYPHHQYQQQRGVGHPGGPGPGYAGGHPSGAGPPNQNKLPPMKHGPPRPPNMSSPNHHPPGPPRGHYMPNQPHGPPPHHQQRMIRPPPGDRMNSGR